MIAFPKNSVHPLPILLVASSDHLTPVTGATVTVTLSKDGGSFTTPAGSVSEIGNGWYKLTPTTADTDTIGVLLLHASASGADPSDTMFQITGVDFDNPTTMGVANLDTAVSSRSTYAGTDTAGTTTLLSRIASAITITSGKVDVNDKTGFALTAAYDPAKTAATQASVNTIDDFLDTEIAAIVAKTNNLPSDPADASDIAASFTALNTKIDTIDDFVDTEVSAIKVVTDKLDTALETDGAVYRYTVNALENAPVGGGGGGETDWTSGEREQIRHRLGIDGTAVAPTATPSLAKPGDAMTLTGAYDAAKTAAAPGAAMILTSAYDAAKTAAPPGAPMTLTAPYDPAKTAAQAGVPVTLTSAYDPAKTAAQAGDAMTLTAAYDPAKTAAQTGAPVTLTSDYDPAKTAAQPGDTMTIDGAQVTEIADEVLTRDWTEVSNDLATESLLQALRSLRNKWEIDTGGTLTVYKEDGVTIAWQRTVVSAVNAVPIVGMT